MVAMRADMMLPQARDLAERGWLAVIVVRRGFGRSERRCPALPADPPTCPASIPTSARGFEIEADDLEGALQGLPSGPMPMVARHRDRHSVGGGTVLAFAARQPKGLRAVINISGGVRIIKGDGNQCADDACRPP